MTTTEALLCNTKIYTRIAVSGFKRQASALREGIETARRQSFFDWCIFLESYTHKYYVCECKTARSLWGLYEVSMWSLWGLYEVSMRFLDTSAYIQWNVMQNSQVSIRSLCGLYWVSMRSLWGLYWFSGHFHICLMNCDSKFERKSDCNVHGPTNQTRPRTPEHSFSKIVLQWLIPVFGALVNARFRCTDKRQFSFRGYVCGYGWRRSTSFGGSTEPFVLVFWGHKWVTDGWRHQLRS